MAIRVSDIAFVRFQAPDLDRMEQFLVAFGMHRAERTSDTLYMRGSDDEGFVHVTHLADEPQFIGLAFQADTEAELRALDGFSDVTDLAGPGGGRVVSAIDPNGFQVEVVAGRGSVGRLATGLIPQLNNAVSHPRKGKPLRLEPGPSQVKRLGHCVLNVNNFRESEAWYKDHFGLVTSDEVVIDADRSLGAFLRCDRGDAYVDHHTLFLVGTGKPAFNHAAFEVASVDDLMTGHTHLTNKDYEHNWGIGRHLLGSQVYDYWKDPFGNVVEHWTDGDLFNNETAPAIASLPDLLASQWGPTHATP